MSRRKQTVMTIEGLKEHLDSKFEHLEKRIDDLERSRDYLSGAWKALTVVGGISVVIIGFLFKAKLF